MTVVGEVEALRRFVAARYPPHVAWNPQSAFDVAIERLAVPGVYGEFREPFMTQGLNELRRFLVLSSLAERDYLMYVKDLDRLWELAQVAPAFGEILAALPRPVSRPPAAFATRHREARQDAPRFTAAYTAAFGSPPAIWTVLDAKGENASVSASSIEDSDGDSTHDWSQSEDLDGGFEPDSWH